MGFKNIAVVLENSPPGGYTPGSTIAGRIVVSADKSFHIRGLTIKVVGEAEVRFTDSVTVTRRRTTIDDGNFGSRSSLSETRSEMETFTAYERYISTSYRILGETLINVGDHEFKFSVILPSNIPSTFKGRHGFIRYWVKVKMDKAWNFDQVVLGEFTVTAPKDLNSINLDAGQGQATLDLAMSHVYRDMKHFNFFCCRTGPLTLAVDLPRSGVVPGETLHLTVDLDNSTTVNITSVKVNITQEIVWTANSPRYNYKTTRDTLLMVHCEGVPKRDNRTWRQAIIIPNVPGINIDVCSIIKIQHFIVVEAVPEGMHMNLSVSAPITIGTIPIGRRISQHRILYDPPYVPPPVPQQPPGVGFVLPPPREIGFVPQPSSAPPTPSFIDHEPPPPYPMTPEPFQPPQIPNKYA